MGERGQNKRKQQNTRETHLDDIERDSSETADVTTAFASPMVASSPMMILGVIIDETTQF